MRNTGNISPVLPTKQAHTTVLNTSSFVLQIFSAFHCLCESFYTWQRAGTHTQETFELKSLPEW